MRPSSLPLATHCRGSYLLGKGDSNQGGGRNITNQFARLGNAFHELAKSKVMNQSADEDAIRHSYGLSEEEMGDLKRMLNKIDITLPADAQAYAEHHLASKILDLNGTPDLFTVNTETKHSCLIDFKSGFLDIEPPEGNYQMISYALMIYENFGMETIECHIVQPRHGEIKSFTFTKAFLEALIPEMKKIIAEAEQPNAPITTGPWCYACFACMKCPAFAGAVVKVCEIMFPDNVGIRPDEAVEAAIKKALPFVKAFARTAKKVEELAKVWVDLHGPLDLGGGWVYQKALDTRQEISVEKALPILQEKFPKAVNDLLKITKTAIESVARKTGIRGVYGLVMKDLEGAGALIEKPTTKYSFVNKGENTDGRQITDSTSR